MPRDRQRFPSNLSRHINRDVLSILRGYELEIFSFEGGFFDRLQILACEATGARFGEIAGLHVEDLDFENSIVHIRRSVYKHQELAPKTDAGYRDVNVDPKVMKIVKKYIGDRTTGRVFDSKKGTPLVCGDINRYVLKPLLEKLGIKPATTHAFRHGRISILQQNRVPGDLIKEWVGHTSLKITSGYTHFDDAYRQDIIKNLK